MFESRLQLVQSLLIPSAILALAGITTMVFGSLAVALFLLFVSHALAATGNWFYAEDKGYPPWLGAALGAPFGVSSAIILLILPDESTADGPFSGEKRISREGIENAKRDKGYEVLDDDD